jgi:hypothetical protein
MSEVIVQSEPLKVHIVVKIARQVEGEFIAINVLKASTDEKVLEKYVADLSYAQVENISGVDCIVEVGVFRDILIED